MWRGAPHAHIHQVPTILEQAGVLASLLRSLLWAVGRTDCHRQHKGEWWIEMFHPLR